MTSWMERYLEGEHREEVSWNYAFGFTFGMLFLGMGASISVQHYSKSMSDKAAMEHGYVQEVDEESGQVLWVKESVGQ